MPPKEHFGKAQVILDVALSFALCMCQALEEQRHEARSFFNWFELQVPCSLGCAFVLPSSILQWGIRKSSNMTWAIGCPQQASPKHWG